MPTDVDHLQERLKQLRSAFDDSFAHLPDAQSVEPVHILIGRTAGVRFGFRMAQLSGLQQFEIITPLPGQVPPLLGITSVAGELIAVFDIAVMLGSGGPRRGGRWLVTAGEGSRRFGLAFDALVGTCQVGPGDFMAAENIRSGDLTPDAIQDEAGIIQMIDLKAVQAIVKNKFGG